MTLLETLALLTLLATVVFGMFDIASLHTKNDRPMSYQLGGHFLTDLPERY